MSATQPVECLYYPHSQLPSAAWAKAALLYWEGLERIVPDGIKPNDPPEVEELVRAGLIQNLSPSPFREATTEIFGTRLEDLLRSRGGKPIEDSSVRSDEQDQLVHLTRMDLSLANDLQAEGLMSAAGEWARMSPTVARLYLVSMATAVAEQLHIAPMTHDDSCDVACTYFTFGNVANDPAAVPPDALGWARLYTPFPSLAVAEALTVPKLLKLREQLTRMRRGFREMVQARTAGLATLKSAEEVRAHLQWLASKMADDLQLQREALHAAKVRDSWTLLGVTAPVSLGAGTALAGGPPLIAVVGGFGSMGLGVSNWYLERGVRQPQGNYLLTLGRALDHKVLERFGDQMRLLVHG